MRDEHADFTGFPSPAEEHRRPPLNLQTLLVTNPISTFFIRFEGDAMRDAHIFDEDLLVVERRTEYADGSIVLAFVENERVVRRLEKEDGHILLCPANEDYRNIEVTEDVRIFGVVRHSITHHFRFARMLPKAR
jgi:DNA polymerase V